MNTDATERADGREVLRVPLPKDVARHLREIVEADHRSEGEYAAYAVRRFLGTPDGEES